MKALYIAASAAAISAALAVPSAASAKDVVTDTPAASATDAAAPTSDAASSVGEVIVTGTRLTGLRAVDSPAPVEVLDLGSLGRVAQPDLIQAIAQNVPSFNAQSFGGDLANVTLSAKLRGISPNDTLVLINGKRRHGSANLAVGAGPYQGGATADLGFIPVEAIDHVEVLEDGAAAQYGTDAIAGVVNIILKNKSEGGEFVTTAGQYIDGGGKAADGSLNIGIAPTKDSFLNLTFESRYHGHSFRGDFDPRAENTPYNGTAASHLANYPTLVNAPGYPDMNRIGGDAAYRINAGTFNAGYDLSPMTEIYSFGSYGRKYGESIENYRVPNQTVGKNGVEPYPFGFTPLETISEDDFAFTSGIRGGTPKTLTWDLSSSYGEDDVGVNVLNSINRSLYIDTSTATTNGFSPTNFHNGDFIGSQWTTNLDLTHDFNVGAATPLTVAGGAEYRHETYEIKAGDTASRYKEGSQSYPGFALTDAGVHDRDNYGVYLDFAVSPVEKLKLDAAVRFENYSDAGSTTVEKLTGRYDFNDAFALRGTISTGFRAPTLAEEYYSATNVSPTSAFVQLPPNSAAARLLGIDGLKPEKSNNYSVGIVTHPIEGLTATLDAYEIDIDDRIVGSGRLFGSGGGTNIAAVRAAILANGNILDPTVTQTGIQIFTNGADTRTRGLDLVLSYPADYGSKGNVTWSLTGNLNDTQVTKTRTPVELAGAALLDKTALSYLETASPKFRITEGAYWTLGKWAVNLKESLYGPVSYWAPNVAATTYYQIKVPATAITDLEVAYKIKDGVKLAVGANNLFNKYPPKINPALRQDYLANNNQSYAVPYPSISPFGFDGGYYYGRLTVKF